VTEATDPRPFTARPLAALLYPDETFAHAKTWDATTWAHILEKWADIVGQMPPDCRTDPYTKDAVNVLLGALARI
jgi:hypothetical protein